MVQEKNSFIIQEESHRDKLAQPSHSDSQNFRRFLMMVFNNWYYFLLTLSLTILLAYFYNKNAIPVYRVTSTVLIDEGESSRLPGIDNRLLEGFRVRPGSQNFENQIIALSSWTLIRSTLDELGFEIDVFRKGWLSWASYFPISPIRVEPAESNGIPLNVEFSLKYLEKNKFQLKTARNSEFDLDTIVSMGQEIEVGRGSFFIMPDPQMETMYKQGDKIFFVFHDLDILTEKYRERLIASPASREGSIVYLQLEGTNKTKDIIFLDKLTEVFMLTNLEKKNREANRVIDHIDKQLVNVTDSLVITENQLQDFRSRNRLMDVSAQGQQIINQAVVLENTRAKLTLESNYYNYLDDYLSEEDNKEAFISPATMGIADPVLARLLQELAGLQAEYYSSGVGERNPLQGQLELRIRNTKQSIKETLQGIKLANQMAMDENTSQINSVNAQATRLPVKERQLLGIERKFNLNNVLYTFLLQKRAESQIQKASNKADNELIDPARAGLLPIAPNLILVYLIAMVSGIGIPYGVIILRKNIRQKITSEDDLRRITELPVVGHIPHSKLNYNTVVLTEPQSRIAEAFRSLRTRMEFFTQEATCPVILVSSTMPGEGKTFSAINLASAYSLIGKRTLLIGFDLRRPTMSKSFYLEKNLGLSTYLIGKNTLEEIIVKTDYPNLDVIPSGPIPPNPGELATSEKAMQMFELLKEKYDFIVIDSAPIGTVSDNYAVANLVDATLVMVRHGKTNKHALSAALADAKAHRVKGLSLIVNDYQLKGSTYSYAYNYRYEARDQKAKSSVRKLFRKGKRS